MSEKASSTQVLTSLLSGELVRYGEPKSFSGLTLVPLFSARRAPFEYVLLSTAVRTGTAAVEEVGGGSVPTLRIVNRGAAPILLVDGEHLIGVKQNRILNTTILVPERSALDIPVSCVERGRWGRSQGSARPASPMLFSNVRAEKHAAVTASVRGSGVFAADQGAIWRGVAQKFTDLAVPSAPTSAMQAAYEHRANDLDQYVKNLPRESGQTGVVAALGPRILCADVFDRPESLEGLWDRLVPSYAVEAFFRPAEAAARTSDAEKFLQDAAKARITEHTAVGRGTDLRLTGDVLVGAALEAEEAIIHLALFPTERPAGEPADPNFATANARRRGMTHSRTRPAQ
jgi:hypothetical protein